ncbi:hypothetical protein [Clostridium minihomine]|uniref:hypothetical protein n=1 Tax=Clostridium minihomine TaxID=2045012 RepID=UPI0013EB5247|nr:hypothetical protein [Clostridium minihomine]
MAEKPKWYLHDLRPIAMSLLSNPNAKSNIKELAKLYEDNNAYAHKYALKEDGEQET